MYLSQASFYLQSVFSTLKTELSQNKRQTMRTKRMCNSHAIS